MAKQLIVSLSREYGSGGHVIADRLSEKFDLPLYDRNMLSEILVEKNLDTDERLEELIKYDELSKKTFFSRTVKGYSNSPAENIAHMQFDFLKKRADKGESFVVVGRCSETVLKSYESMISIFVMADKEAKLERIQKLFDLSTVEAKDLIRRQDKERKYYHNRYSDYKWGDSRNYDLCINSSKLGIERTADMLEHYIKERIKDC